MILCKFYDAPKTHSEKKPGHEVLEDEGIEKLWAEAQL